MTRRARITPRQMRLWEELNLWHAMLAGAQGLLHWEERNMTWGYIPGFFEGLCAMHYALTYELHLPDRAYSYRQRHGVGQHGYWWPTGSWTPRVRFIQQMIREIEQELAQ